MVNSGAILGVLAFSNSTRGNESQNAAETRSLFLLTILGPLVFLIVLVYFTASVPRAFYRRIFQLGQSPFAHNTGIRSGVHRYEINRRLSEEV